MKEPKRKRRLTLLAGILGVIAGLVLSVGLVGKYRVLPRIIRSRLQDSAGEFWGGQFSVGEVDFRYFSATRLRDITLRDAAGRDWLRAGEVRVEVTDAMRKPRIEAVEIDSLELIAQCTNGRCRPPLKELSEDFRRLLRQVRNFETRDVRILRSDDGGPERLLARLDFRAAADGELRRAVARAGTEDSRSLRMTFHARPLDDRRWNVSQGRAYLNGDELIHSAEMVVEISDEGVEVDNMEADFCNGRLTATGRGFVAPDGCMEYRADVNIHDSSPELLAQAMGWGELPAGTADASVKFHGGAGGLDTLRGLGSVDLRDMAFQHAGGFADIRRRLGLSSGWEQCDFQMEFLLTGPIVTVRNGTLTAAGVTARIQPGGTIDLLSRELDFYVTASAKGYLSELDFLPSAQAVSKLYGKLTRQRVRGRWDRLEGLRITPAPLQR